MCTREFVAALCSGLFAVLRANALADRLYEPLSVLLVPAAQLVKHAARSTVSGTRRRLRGGGDAAVPAAVCLADGTRLHCAN